MRIFFPDGGHRITHNFHKFDGDALLVQRIEWGPPEPLIQVQFLGSATDFFFPKNEERTLVRRACVLVLF